MKKPIKKKKNLFGGKVTLTIDERLNKIDLKALAPKKLAEANRHLKKMKSLPE